MDSWAGKACTPITLNKYVYGNSDPAYYVDPSGHIAGLVSVSFSSFNVTHVRMAGVQAGRQGVRNVKQILCRVAATGLEQGHHVVPVFMGGPFPVSSGNVVKIDAKFHSQFHSLLNHMLKARGLLGGTVKKEVWEELFKRAPETRDDALKVLVQAAKIFDKACKLKGQNKIAPVIKKQIKDGKWEF